MARAWFGALTLTLLFAVQGGAAEVVVLKSSDVPGWRPAVEALRRAVSAHTVAEFDLRGDAAEAVRVLAGLQGREVHLVALGPLAAQAARQQLPDAPLVFAMVSDPASIGLAAAPGVTGVAFSIPVRNQLAAFRMVNPRGVRVGVVHGDAVADLVAEAQKGAALIRLAVMARRVASEREVPQALRSLLGEDGVDAVWVPLDPLLLGEDTRRFLLSETLKAGKPVYSSSGALVSEGALVSDGPDVVSIGELAGELVNRMAAGEKGRIEMLVPRAELVVNKKIADKLKIDIPADALRAASKVF